MDNWILYKYRFYFVESEICDFVHFIEVNERKAARDLQGESRGVKILADDVREQQKSDEMHDRWVLTANVLNRFFMMIFVFSIFLTLVAVFMMDKPEKLSTQAHT